jgi:hypothetical protein
MISVIPGDVTLWLLVGAIAIFIYLSARSKSIKSFQFQISIFILIYITGEIADLLQRDGYIQFIKSQDFGLAVHMSAMAFFCLLILLRYYSSTTKGRKIIDNV